MEPHILPSDNTLLVCVGWGEEHSSYYATVIDITDPQNDYALVSLGELGSPTISDPAVVLDAVRGYADIPDGLLEQLTNEANLNRLDPA
jgi:hypothetical protein